MEAVDSAEAVDSEVADLEAVAPEEAGDTRETMSYTKWIGGALGWALGGPIGGILGYAFGSMMADKSLSMEDGPRGGREQRQAPHGGGPRRRQTGGGDFAVSMIVLSAAVMKADERILKSELDYVKRFFVSNFGQQQAERYVLTLREVLKQDVDTRAVCQQIRGLMEHSKRLLLLQYLYGIAQADGHVDPREVDVIRRMATWLGISDKDQKSIEATFYTDVASHYAVLEVDRNVSDAEVKKAYRRMAVKFHPDKVGDMGADYQKQARVRFDRIQEAYEAIKKERGLK